MKLSERLERRRLGELSAAVAADDLRQARALYYKIAEADPGAEEVCVESVSRQWKSEVRNVRESFEAARGMVTKQSQALTSRKALRSLPDPNKKEGDEALFISPTLQPPAENVDGGRATMEAEEIAKLKAGAGQVRAAAAPSAPVTFQHSKNPVGIPASLANALVAFKELRVDCRYDQFHDKIIVAGYAAMMNGDASENLDNLVLMLREQVLTRFGFDPGDSYMQDALRIVRMKHIFDPVRDYLDTLTWDGTPRLDRWLIDYCKAADTPLNRAFSRKVLIAATRRVRSPGYKFDFILVLEGPQGIGKSTLLKILAGEENFSDNEILGLDKREQQEAVQGVWIYELCELDGLSKSEVTAIKLFASKTVDSARPAYGRSRVDRPRRLIFIATTNEDTYLRDTTGNRRFWPVKVG